jgi:hypothetical protein
MRCGISLLTSGIFFLAFCLASNATAAAEPRIVGLDPQGKLTYQGDEHGNRVPDFSYAGYMGGGVTIPDAPVRVVVSPAEGDDGARIQAALDYVAGLPADEHGLRGAVLLEKGHYEVAGDLQITTGGVVLRGMGADESGTAITAAGDDRRTLIRIFGRKDRRDAMDQRRRVAQPYVSVDSTGLRLDSTAGLREGQRVIVTHPSTLAWIDTMGMGNPGYKGHLSWKPGLYNAEWDRTIRKIQGDAIELDAPLTMAIDARLSSATVTPYDWPGRIAQVGVENLRCVSAFDPANPQDEEHAWMAITMEAVENAWVRQVTAVHFASSLVCVWETCRAVTIEDCQSLAPVSEVAGYRRHSFYTSGQLTLMQRCRSEEGKHDFGVGWLARRRSSIATRHYRTT